MEVWIFKCTRDWQRLLIEKDHQWMYGSMLDILWFCSDINNDSLAAFVGIELLQKNIQGKKFFVASIDVKYNEDNVMLNVDHWLAFSDRGGCIHSKAQAGAK